MAQTWTLQVGIQQWHGVQAVLFDKDGTIADTAAFLSRLGEVRIAAIARQVPGVEAALRQAWGITAGGEVDPAGALAVESRDQNGASAVAVLMAGGMAGGMVDEMTGEMTGGMTGDRPPQLHNQVMQWIADADQTLGAKAPQTPLYPDAAAAIARLAAAGIPLGIVSADTPAQVQAFVAYYGLQGAIAVAYGSTPALTKPHADFFQAACHALGVSPTSTVVVGDAASDVALARAGDARCVLVQRRSPLVDTRIPRSNAIPTADQVLPSLDSLKVISPHPAATKVV